MRAFATLLKVDRIVAGMFSESSGRSGQNRKITKWRKRPNRDHIQQLQIYGVIMQVDMIPIGSVWREIGFGIDGHQEVIIEHIRMHILIGGEFERGFVAGSR